MKLVIHYFLTANVSFISPLPLQKMTDLYIFRIMWLCRTSLQSSLNIPALWEIYQGYHEWRKSKTRMETVNGKGIVEQHPLDLEQYSIAFSKEEVFPLTH
jgi:hypothetical protein